MTGRTVSQHMSRNVVDLLIVRGMTATQIARLLGVSKSYISRVKAGTRSFTLEHLLTLERELGRPIPLLLMEAIPRDTVSEKARPLYDSIRELLRDVAEPAPRASRKPASPRRDKTKRPRAA